MPSDWKKCIEEGEKIINDLEKYYETMIDYDEIKHFDIEPATSTMMGYYEEIKRQYGLEIHHSLVSWIRKEASDGRLFERTNWKPFRKPDIYTICYQGYRKLFQYGKYYFQLSIIRDWNEEKNREEGICFEALLYGWKEDNILNIQPDNEIFITDELWIPKKYWEWE
jgi:hypothetical protein